MAEDRHLKCPGCDVVLPLTAGDSGIYFEQYARIARHSESHNPPIKGAWILTDTGTGNEAENG